MNVNIVKLPNIVSCFETTAGSSRNESTAHETDLSTSDDMSHKCVNYVTLLRNYRRPSLDCLERQQYSTWRLSMTSNGCCPVYKVLLRPVLSSMFQPRFFSIQIGVSYFLLQDLGISQVFFPVFSNSNLGLYILKWTFPFRELRITND